MSTGEKLSAQFEGTGHGHQLPQPVIAQLNINRLTKKLNWYILFHEVFAMTSRNVSRGS